MSVRADLLAPGRDDLGPLRGLPDERCRPVGLLVTSDPPQFVARPGIVRSHERLRVVVVHDVQPAIVQRRGRGSAPAHAHRQHVHRPGPGDIPREVERIKARVAEIHVHALAVGDRRFRRHRVLVVDRLCGRGRAQHALPPRLAGVGIDVVHDPAVFGGRAVDVLAGARSPKRARDVLRRRAERLDRPGAVDRRNDEHVVAPDDR